MSETFHVLVPENIAPEGVALLEEDPRFRVTFKKLTGDDLYAAVKDADALIVRSATKVNGDLLAHAPKLRAVARAGVGVDNIDLDASTKAGVLVMNTPDGNTVSAAEQTLTLLMATARHTASADKHVHEKKWERKKFMGAEMRGKTLGVVGLGKIGRRVAKYAQALDMKVIGSDPILTREAAEKMGIELVDFERIVSDSDFITLHVPLNEHTKDMIDAEAIGRMKPGVRIVNVARGGVVNEADLATALKEGRVAGAGLDVFASEPPAPDSPLYDAVNLTMTPHLGASTKEAQELVGIDAARQIRDYLADGMVKNAVNAPTMDPADLEALAPYVSLTRKLGSLQAQILHGDLKKIQVVFSGPDFEGRDKTFLMRGVLEGFFSHYQSEPVNFVNVDMFAKQHGVTLERTSTPESRGSYVNLITVEVETSKGKRSVSGTPFGKGAPRLVYVDDHHMDAIPEGHALIFCNDDRPGMLGHVATTLGAGNVNIANVSLGRNKPKGQAITFLNLDEPLTDDMKAHVSTMPGIIWMHTLQL